MQKSLLLIASVKLQRVGRDSSLLAMHYKAKECNALVPQASDLKAKRDPNSDFTFLTRCTALPFDGDQMGHHLLQG